MAVTVQFRRDTAANWTSINPILAQGEFAIELDTSKYKVGNGIAHWNSLPYGGPGGSGTKIEMFQLSGPEVSAKQKTLALVATSVNETLLWIDGVTIQKYGIDYSVSGNLLDWNGLGMETIIEVGDYIIIQYKI